MTPKQIYSQQLLEEIYLKLRQINLQYEKSDIHAKPRHKKTKISKLLYQ